MEITSTFIEHNNNKDKLKKLYFIIYNLYALFFTSFMMYTSYHSMEIFIKISNTINPKLNSLECIIGIIFKELDINITKCSSL